jgi:hypothetical protein
VRDPANKAEATQLLIDRLKLPPAVAAKSYALATDPVDGMFQDAQFASKVSAMCSGCVPRSKANGAAIRRRSGRVVTSFLPLAST